MATFLLIRLLRWTAGLFLILFVAYAMMYYGAGDPIRMMFIQGEDFDTEDEVVMRALRKKYGLDEPFIVQFSNYLNNLARGDWGASIRLQVDRPVIEMVEYRLPISMQMGFAATLIASVVGLALGIFAALYHNRWLDRLIISTVLFVTSIPVFVMGPTLLLVLVLQLKVMDVPYGWPGLFDRDMVLPFALIALGPLPIIVRQTRSAMLEVKGQLYVRTARAKGVPESRIILRHMLRPILTPVVTTWVWS